MPSAAEHLTTPPPVQTGSATLQITVPAALDPDALSRALRSQIDDMLLLVDVRTRLQSAHTPLAPNLLAAVAEQERRWRDIESRYGLLDSGAVADIAGSRARNRSEYASSLRAKGQLLAVQRGGRYLYPGFQFANSGRVHPVVPRVIQVMASQGWDTESITLWMVSPNGYLGGDTPVERIADAEAVLDAAVNAAHAGR